MCELQSIANWCELRNTSTALHTIGTYVPLCGMKCRSITRMGAASVGPLTPFLVWGRRGMDSRKPRVVFRSSGDTRIARNLEDPYVLPRDFPIFGISSLLAAGERRACYIKGDNKTPMGEWTLGNNGSLQDSHTFVF